ncbi:MAG: hypothetical protein ACRC9T_01790, partial [Vibrionaceae bacterium]
HYLCDFPELKPMIAALTTQKYWDAQKLITQFLQSRRGLVCVVDAQMAALILERQALESRLQQLIDEQAEQQSKIDEYHLLHHRHLSPLLAKILDAREQIAALNLNLAQMPLRLQQAELAREIRRLEAQIQALERECAAQHAKKQAQYNEAQAENNSYRQQQAENVEQFNGVAELSNEQRQELKQLYRCACKLAHPDLVGVENREQAHLVMVEINAAKKACDIKALRQLLHQLEAGLLSGIAVAKDDLEALRLRIKDLQSNINELEAILLRQRQDDELNPVLENDDINAFIDKQASELTAFMHELDAEKAQLAAEFTNLKAQLDALNND